MGLAYACSSHAKPCKYHVNTMQESHAATSAICKYICRSQFLHAFTYASPDWCICKSHASVSSLNTSRAQICSGAPGRIAGDSKNMCANPGSNPGRITGIRKNRKNVRQPGFEPGGRSLIRKKVCQKMCIIGDSNPGFTDSKKSVSKLNRRRVFIQYYT